MCVCFSTFPLGLLFAPKIAPWWQVFPPTFAVTCIRIFVFGIRNTVVAGRRDNTPCSVGPLCSCGRTVPRSI